MYKNENVIFIFDTVDLMSMRHVKVVFGISSKDQWYMMLIKNGKS